MARARIKQGTGTLSGFRGKRRRRNASKRRTRTVYDVRPLASVILKTRLLCRGVLEARILTQRRGDAEAQKGKEREAFALVTASSNSGLPSVRWTKIAASTTIVAASLSVIRLPPSLLFCASASPRLCVRIRRPRWNDAAGVPMCSTLRLLRSHDTCWETRSLRISGRDSGSLFRGEIRIGAEAKYLRKLLQHDGGDAASTDNGPSRQGRARE